jgi:spermidine synthase
MQKKFFDPWTRNTFLTYTVRRFYESFETEYQKIDVFEAEDFGNVLALGGVTNVTDRDESGYHEMLAHVPMFLHPNPKEVLIIGGGDGGTLREVLRHPSVTRAVLVDIDGEVIRCARQYFPRLAEAFDDPRAEVIVGDGLAYVAEAAEAGRHFDVLLCDSTDPVDAAVELFTEAFYQQCARLVGEEGIFVPQSDSPTFCADRVASIHRTLDRVFRHATPYLGQVVAYPGGVWTYTGCTQGEALRQRAIPSERIAAMEAELRYFNAEILPACFALPNYLRRALSGGPRWELPSISDNPLTMRGKV